MTRSTRALAEVGARFPPGAQVQFLNDKTLPMTFLELQSLGELPRPQARLE